MNRLWLICALAALCAACVARKEAANNTPSANRQAAPIRAPLPLFHPDYKAGQPYHEYSEQTEANLTRFAALVAKTERVNVRRVPFSPDHPPAWIDVTDALDIAEMRWAFSGELMETRRVGMGVFGTAFEFELSDGTSIELTDWGDHYAVSFPGATWSMIRPTERMRAALKPAHNRLRNES
jgi:hypothetical protein